MQKRFLLISSFGDGCDWTWFETQDEMRDFLDYFESMDTKVLETFEVVNGHQIELTD